MNIEFLKARRASFNVVKATYALDGTEFTVEWNNVHSGTGELGDYDLQLNTHSLNSELACRVDDAIREGESDSNPDLELYLTVRDSYDHGDCMDCDTPAFQITHQHELDAQDLGGSALTALGGCSQEEQGLGDWQYQFDVLVLNNSREIRQFTIVYQPEERSDGMKCYSGYDITTASRYGCDIDESDELERFCDYDTSVLDTLHDIAHRLAKAKYEKLIAEQLPQ